MSFTSRLLSLPITAFALVGCASAPVSPLVRPAPETQGEVIVFRESSFAAGGVALKVGTQGSVFAYLENGEKVRAMLPAGKHEVFVQARSAEPTKVSVSIERAAPVCLRTSASPSSFAKAAIPISLILTGYHFYLDQVPCPPIEELKKYNDIPVTYR